MIEKLEEIKQKMQELIKIMANYECYNKGAEDCIKIIDKMIEVEDCIKIIDKMIEEEKDNPFRDSYM